MPANARQPALPAAAACLPVALLQALLEPCPPCGVLVVERCSVLAEAGCSGGLIMRMIGKGRAET
jgi:hypothetical protein